MNINLIADLRCQKPRALPSVPTFYFWSLYTYDELHPLIKITKIRIWRNVATVYHLLALFTGFGIGVVEWPIVWQCQQKKIMTQWTYFLFSWQCPMTDPINRERVIAYFCKKYSGHNHYYEQIVSEKFL